TNDGSLLVRGLTIAQRVAFKLSRGNRVIGKLLGKPARNCNIIICRVLKRSRGQLTTLRQIESALSDSLSDVAGTSWAYNNHDQLEWLNLKLFQLIKVIRLAGISQNARMHAWMQGLNAAFEALWESGERFNRSDVNTKISNLGGGGAGGHNLYACAVKRASELFEPCLVINAN